MKTSRFPRFVWSLSPDLDMSDRGFIAGLARNLYSQEKKKMLSDSRTLKESVRSKPTSYHISLETVSWIACWRSTAPAILNRAFEPGGRGTWCCGCVSGWSRAHTPAWWSWKALGCWHEAYEPWRPPQSWAHGWGRFLECWSADPACASHQRTFQPPWEDWRESREAHRYFLPPVAQQTRWSNSHSHSKTDPRKHARAARVSVRRMGASGGSDSRRDKHAVFRFLDLIKT